MQTMDSSRTDERLGSLDRRVGETNREMREEFRSVRTEIRDVRLELNTRFDATQKLIVTLTCTVIGGFVSVLATLVATQL